MTWLLAPVLPGLSGPGLDGSWIWAINNLPSDTLPGRDVVFTYGPLGQLLWPLADGPHVPWGWCFQWAVLILSLCGIAGGVRSASLPRMLSITVLLTIAGFVGLAPEYRCILLLAILAARWIAEEDAGLGWLAALAGLATAALLIKTSIAVCGALLLVVALVPGSDLRGSRWAKAVFCAVALICATALTLIGLVFRGPANFIDWLKGEAELVSGYATAMSKSGSSLEVWLAVAMLATFGVVGILALRVRARTARVWLAFGLVLFVAFRHGFVRHDTHVLGYFSLATALAALLLLRARPGTESRTAAVLALVAAACALDSIAVRNLAPQLFKRTTVLLSGQRLAALVPPWRTLDGPRGAARIQRISDLGLAPEQLAAIPGGASVDAIPSELGYLPANDLRWTPSPTLQLYAAYTRALDERVARHFAGPTAPRALLIHDASIDGRNQVWDTPQTWRTVIAQYELSPEGPRRGVMVALRRDRPLEWQPRELRQERMTLGEWQGVPEVSDGELLFVDIDLRHSATGSIAAALWRVLPVYVEAQVASGRSIRTRLIPGTAAAGVLLSPIPTGVRGLAALWRGGQGPRPVRWRIVGPGASTFAAQASLRWWSAPSPSREAISP